ncbi:hypothetical protein ACFXHA_41425 [Nocardia sp. NPDC059240]|uniref:hypothetical protein n=1 Tax=Nocardia sp. NPDC059240 TaxID=3346786 RepID=UPI0036760531
MGSFDIDFTGEHSERDSSLAVGIIRLRDMEERFHAPIGFWTIEDYRRSWDVALRKVIDDAGISCLVTSMLDPATANFIQVWPLYRDGATVHVQNRLIFLAEEPSFDATAPWDCLGPRSTVNEDGDHISEWSVSTADVEHFLIQSDS